HSSRLLWLCAGIVLGGLGAFLTTGATRVAQAATHDRYDDFIMCTGPASLFPGVSIDGLWLLDYKAGKLLGTIIDRQSGRITSWGHRRESADFKSAATSPPALFPPPCRYGRNKEGPDVGTDIHGHLRPRLLPQRRTELPRFARAAGPDLQMAPHRQHHCLCHA